MSFFFCSLLSALSQLSFSLRCSLCSQVLSGVLSLCCKLSALSQLSFSALCSLLSFSALCSLSAELLSLCSLCCKLSALSALSAELLSLRCSQVLSLCSLRCSQVCYRPGGIKYYYNNFKARLGKLSPYCHHIVTRLPLWPAKCHPKVLDLSL